MFKREVAVELRGEERNLLNLALDQCGHLRQLADWLREESVKEATERRLTGYTKRPGLANTVDEYRQIVDGEKGSVVTILSPKTFDTSRQEQLEFGMAYGCEPVDRETHVQMLSALLKRTVKTQSSDPEPDSYASWLRSAACPDPSESRALDVYREKIVKDASGGLQVTNNVIVQYNKQRADADSSNSNTAMLLMRAVEGPKQQPLEAMPFLDRNFEQAKLVSAVVATSLQDKSTARQSQGLATPSEDYAALAEQIRRHFVGSHSVSLGGYQAIIGQLVAGRLGMSSGSDADFARYGTLEAVHEIMFQSFNRRIMRKAYDVVLIETDEPQTREQQKRLGKKLGLEAGSFEQGKEYVADLREKVDKRTATTSEIRAYNILQGKRVRLDDGAMEVQNLRCIRRDDDGPDNRSVMFYVSRVVRFSTLYEVLFYPSIQELYGEVTKSVRKVLKQES